METELKCIYIFGPIAESSHYRPLCNNRKITTSCVQQSLCRPAVQRSRCSYAARVGNTQQLRKRAIQVDFQDPADSRNAGDRRNSHCPIVACTASVSKAQTNGSDPSFTENLSNKRKQGNARNIQERKTANFCLGHMWTQKLICVGWSPRAIQQLPFHLAPSTRLVYNAILRKSQDLPFRVGYFPTRRHSDCF